MVSDSSSLRNTVSPSPPPAPQILLQKVDDRSDSISPQNHGWSAGTDESQNARPDASSRETSQHLPPDADGNRSENDFVSPQDRDGSVGMDKGPNATLQVPPSHVEYDYSGSTTNLQNTLDGRNTSGGDVDSERPSELSARKFVFVVAETSIGSDFNRGSDDNDEGDYLSKMRQDDLETSGMLLISTLPTRTLHGWRFNSECR